MTLSRRSSLFLLAFGVWSWFVWVTLVRNIVADPKSFSDGHPTAFLIVHVVLAVISIVLGTTIGLLGWRGWRATRTKQAESIDTNA